jgi:hypothetical protein
VLRQHIPGRIGTAIVLVVCGPLFAMPIVATLPNAVGETLAIAWIVASVVLAVRGYRMAVEVRPHDVVVRGLLRTWTVPRAGIISVTEYATLVWRDADGRAHSTPMVVLETGKTLQRWQYITENQRATLRRVLGLENR